MAAATFKTQDGTTISDGDEVTLILMYDYEEVEATGTVREFEQVERVYDEEHIAIGKTSERHWELLTGDAHHPAIGFLPENVKTRIGK